MRTLDVAFLPDILYSEGLWGNFFSSFLIVQATNATCRSGQLKLDFNFLNVLSGVCTQMEFSQYFI